MFLEGPSSPTDGILGADCHGSSKTLPVRLQIFGFFQGGKAISDLDTILVAEIAILELGNVKRAHAASVLSCSFEPQLDLCHNEIVVRPNIRAVPSDNVSGS